MAFTCNACGGCGKELNAQLQALQSRVKTIERDNAMTAELQIIGFIKTILAFVTAGQATAAAILSADPQIMLAILGKQGWAQLMSMIPGISFQSLFAEMSIENLCLPPFDDVLGDLIADAIGDKVVAAQQELQDAINNNLPADQIADLTAKVACLNAALGAGISFKSNQNRLSKCGTASSLISAATSS